MTEEPSLISVAGSSSKHTALEALICFNILDMCATITLTRPNMFLKHFVYNDNL